MSKRRGENLAQQFLGAIYLVCLLVAFALRLIQINSPLWLDETVSFVQINGGFGKIYAHQGWPGIPAYLYILWLFTKILGTSEIALRIPSIRLHDL